MLKKGLKKLMKPLLLPPLDVAGRVGLNEVDGGLGRKTTPLLLIFMSLLFGTFSIELFSGKVTVRVGVIGPKPPVVITGLVVGREVVGRTIGAELTAAGLTGAGLTGRLTGAGFTGRLTGAGLTGRLTGTMELPPLTAAEQRPG